MWRISLIYMLVPLLNAKESNKFAMPSSECSSNVKEISGAMVTYQYYREEQQQPCQLSLKPHKDTSLLHINFVNVNLADCNVWLAVYLSEGTQGDPFYNFTCEDNELPPTQQMQSYVTFLLNKKLSSPDRFEIVVTAVIQDGDCDPPYEFKCDNNNCIENDLACDDINHCFDNSDEEKDDSGTKCIAKHEEPIDPVVLIILLIIAVVIVLGGCCSICYVFYSYRHPKRIEGRVLRYPPTSGFNNPLFNSEQPTNDKKW